ncbi:hypothetical protein G6F56_004504 [Rhizopus delemar]|nr:hypothetical protein G6F56_004504 [Rhizopus delemar]
MTSYGVVSIYKRLDAHSLTNGTLAQGNPNAFQPVMTVAEKVDDNDGFTLGAFLSALPLVSTMFWNWIFPNISYICLFVIQAGNGSPNTSFSFTAAVASSVSPAIAKRDVAAFATTSSKTALGAFAVAGTTATVFISFFQL